MCLGATLHCSLETSRVFRSISGELGGQLCFAGRGDLALCHDMTYSQNDVDVVETDVADSIIL